MKKICGSGCVCQGLGGQFYDLFAINLWVIFENREKYMPMIR
jgi:hypothetical protein